MTTLKQDNIKYLAVARASDKVVLCSFVPFLQNPALRVDESFYRDMTDKVIRAPTWREQVDPNTSHSLDCAPNKFHFRMDDDQRIFIAIAAGEYPARLAFQLIEQFRQSFVSRVGSKFANCGENGLNKECMRLMKDLAARFDDRTKLDKVSDVAQRVDDVKIVMHDNIQSVLANTEKMEAVEEKTVHLNEQAKVFRNTGRNLQRKMWWKNFKLNLTIGLCGVLVLIILLAILGVFDKNESE